MCAFFFLLRAGNATKCSRICHFIIGSYTNVPRTGGDAQLQSVAWIRSVGTGRPSIVGTAKIGHFVQTETGSPLMHL